jgi:predicted nuclease of restriction endonuclease-like RecB superfamily
LVTVRFKEFNHPVEVALVERREVVFQEVEVPAVPTAEEKEKPVVVALVALRFVVSSQPVEVALVLYREVAKKEVVVASVAYRRVERWSILSSFPIVEEAVVEVAMK